MCNDLILLTKIAWFICRTEIHNFYFKWMNNAFVTKAIWKQPCTRHFKKSSPPVFLLKLLQTLELTPKTLWVLVLTLLPQWCKILNSCKTQIIELEPRRPLKKIVFFWLIPYKIQIMITSLNYKCYTIIWVTW